jgi:hypothetical protein
MEVEKNVRIVYTKESIVGMILENAAQSGYDVNPKSVKFVDKRGNKSNFKQIVIDEVIEQPQIQNENVEPEKEKK